MTGWKGGKEELEGRVRREDVGGFERWKDLRDGKEVRRN